MPGKQKKGLLPLCRRLHAQHSGASWKWMFRKGAVAPMLMWHSRPRLCLLFLYLVFLPLAIFGRSLRTFSTPSSNQE
jgi:hypothetical protein